MNKIFIGIITQNEKSNIEDLTAYYRYFDGLASVDHGSDDGTYEILDERKGVGFVEKIPYYGHHGHSMNHFLLNPKIGIGDWILLRDSNERINEDFAKNIRGFLSQMENNGIGSIYQYSKLLLFKRFPNQFFANTPHWGLQNAQPKHIQIDQQNWFSSDEKYCYSVRNKNRDCWHFVGAYLRYYLMKDSNHCLLGLEKNGDPNILFPIRNNRRIRFLLALEEYSIPASKDAVIDVAGHLYKYPNLTIFFNEEKILNDAYRYHILGDRQFKDNHDFKDMVEIKSTTPP